jgi:KDO2-lipid IV(A) lauroyltransferase
VRGSVHSSIEVINMVEPQHEYVQAVAQLRASILGDQSQAYTPVETARTSANLFHLRPEIPVDLHADLTRRIYFHQRRAHLDQFFLDALVPGVHEIGPQVTIPLSGSPAIVCTYHYGPYRLLLPHLLLRGVKVSMLIDQRVADAQGGELEDILRRFCTRWNLPQENFRIRDTSKPGMLLSLRRDLRAGYSVLVFIDGNIGADRDMGAGEHTAPVPFLDATLHSRTGVAVLANMARVPIVPVLMKRSVHDELTNELHALAPIGPGYGEREDCVRHACVAMWQPLDAALRADPLPWESWRYVDRSLDLAQLQARHPPSPGDGDPSRVIFNEERFALDASNAEPVLFDRVTYRLRPLSPSLLRFLEQFRGTPRSCEYALAQPKMTPATWRQLLDLGVLQAA